MPDVLCEMRNNNKKPCLYSIIPFHQIQTMPGAETLTSTLSSIQSLSPELFPFITRAIKIVSPNLIWDISLDTLQRQAG